MNKLPQVRILAARRMHEALEKLVQHDAVFAALRARHHGSAAGGRLRRIRPGLGIEQRQFCHPFGRLPRHS